MCIRDRAAAGHRRAGGGRLPADHVLLHRKISGDLNIQKYPSYLSLRYSDVYKRQAEGLDRPVAFYDMMEQPDIKPWLRKELLLITTGYAIRNDKEAVLTLIRDLNEAGASALAIKTRFFDRFPQEALELADNLHFPLFFLDNGVGLSLIHI